jgi:hypothetical protein
MMHFSPQGTYDLTERAPLGVILSIELRRSETRPIEQDGLAKGLARRKFLHDVLLFPAFGQFQ